MSSAVFVESNVSGSGFRVLQLAHELGLHTVLVTRDPSRYLRVPGASQLLERCVDTMLHCETNDPGHVVNTIAAHGVRPQSVVSVGEYHISVAAQVACHLGLPGTAPEAVAAARDKGRTRAICQDAGVPVPAFAAVEDADEAILAARRVGLPCVVKPVDGSASEGVRLCHTEDDVAVAVAALRQDPVNPAGQRRSDTILVEQYLVGPEVSVETIAHGGTITLVTVTDKSVAGRPFFVETGHLLPSGLPADLVERCARTAREALAALGIDLGVCHTELKIVDGIPYLIEVNARPAGDRITDLVELAIGVPLLLYDLLLRMGQAVQVTPSRHRGAAIHFLTAPAGQVREVAGAGFAKGLPGVEEVELAVRPGELTGPLVKNGSRCGHVIATADTGYFAALLARAAAEEITIDVEPAPQLAAQVAGGPR